MRLRLIIIVGAIGYWLGRLVIRNEMRTYQKKGVEKGTESESIIYWGSLDLPFLKENEKDHKEMMQKIYFGVN